mmetsp:Transcript_24707/g.72478  ORF Transcript_24707/g.72478 Transcript_24707/m.72478 type:complete len:266 (+) Transcript_24707:2346-3143(+)
MPSSCTMRRTASSPCAMCRGIELRKSRSLLWRSSFHLATRSSAFCLSAHRRLRSSASSCRSPVLLVIVSLSLAWETWRSLISCSLLAMASPISMRWASISPMRVSSLPMAVFFATTALPRLSSCSLKNLSRCAMVEKRVPRACLAKSSFICSSVWLCLASRVSLACLVSPYRGKSSSSSSFRVSAIRTSRACASVCSVAWVSSSFATCSSISLTSTSSFARTLMTSRRSRSIDARFLDSLANSSSAVCSSWRPVAASSWTFRVRS